MFDTYLKNFKMRKTIFNLVGQHAFEEQIFQCQLSESLGLVRRCFICDHYIKLSVRLADCDDTCECHDFVSKTQLIRHYCCKIFDEIESQLEPGPFFILELGLTKDQNGTLIFAEYLTPLKTSSFFTQPTVLTQFYDSFQDCGNTRLSELHI